ncbi:tyrosine-type recombinase/integrase [Methylomonas sp. BW4-1]|uniref:tyrosine-type recombinase/integrase n=1 Tax=Methylomonas TaxID=416 RepID=UPI000BC2EC8F|nr:site-specific integrase [Methylomonas koyamae]ATG92618.1 integrase [Methylomonas koyamae]
MTNLVWERYPFLSENPYGRSWLVLLGNLGRADATLDAYARALSNYFRFCQGLGVEAEKATLEHVSLYVRYLGGDAQDGKTSYRHSNATMQQYLTAVRLWYDHLVYQDIRDFNPVPRGTYLNRNSDYHPGFAHGLIRRLKLLPAIPSEEDWKKLIEAVTQESLRNRLMFALAYYGALRREELVNLRVTDFDFAHRLIRIRPETTKSSTPRTVCYAATAGNALSEYLVYRHRINQQAGLVFFSESRRNAGQPISKWTWSKIVEGLAKQAGVEGFSTHSLRHLRLTHLAQAGWKLHELSAYAGHRNPQTTLMYLHLSGADLLNRMTEAIRYADAKIDAALFAKME